MFPELFGALRWKDSVQTHTDAVHLHCQQRVLLLSSSKEVHVHLELRYAACHQLSVAAEDIAAVGLYFYAVAFQPRCHLGPVLFLGRHYIKRLTDDGNAKYRQCYRNRKVAGHHFLSFKLAHFSGTFIIYGGWSDAFKRLSLLSLSCSNT